MRTSNRRPRGGGPQRGGRRGNKSRGGGRSGGGGRSRAPVEPLHPTETPPDIESFREWELEPGVLDAIEGMGITKPTPIQALATQPVLDGRDVIAKAETGTGKTLAFGAPMMSRVDAERVSVLGLVMCPTRELAEQVAKVLEAIGKPRGLGVALIVGGEPAEPQVKALQSGSQVVVGTPGRILDLYNQKFLSFPWTEFVVLDEADTMLEIGFIDDIKKIISYTPDERQTLLFSATFPPDLLTLAREHTTNPVEVATASGVSTVDTIDQVCISLAEDDRPLALTRLIEQSEDDDVFLIFCERRTAVDRLMRRLERLPFGVKALHGGYDQASRFRVMSAFRTGDVKALVATDVASRGLDVKHVTHVVNYAAPGDVTTYTHRIGRTGRAGRTGKAISFVVPADRRRWSSIVREATWEIPEIDPPGPTGRGRRGGSDRDRPSRSRDRGRDEERPRRARRRDEDDDRSPRGAARARRRDEAETREERAPARREGRDAQEGDQRSRRGGGRGRGGRRSRDGSADREDRSPASRPDRSPPERTPDEGTAQPFGAGTESAEERKPRRRSKPKKDAPRKKPEPAPEAPPKKPDAPDFGDFGSGL